MDFIISVIAAIIAFFVVYRFSNFFIAPKAHWTKSKAGIINKKFNMAFTIAAVVFPVVLYLLLEE